MSIPLSKLIEWVKQHDVGITLEILSFVYGGFGVGLGVEQWVVGGFLVLFVEHE